LVQYILQAVYTITIRNKTTDDGAAGLLPVARIIILCSFWGGASLASFPLW